jgi:hypothetical protein
VSPSGATGLTYLTLSDRLQIAGVNSAGAPQITPSFMGVTAAGSWVATGTTGISGTVRQVVNNNRNYYVAVTTANDMYWTYGTTTGLTWTQITGKSAYFYLEGNLACSITITTLLLTCSFIYPYNFVTFNAPANLSKVSFSGRNMCIINTTGELWCCQNFAMDKANQLVWKKITTGTTMRSVAVNGDKVCATTTNDEVYCASDLANYSFINFTGQTLRELSLASDGSICGTAPSSNNIFCTVQSMTTFNQNAANLAVGRLYLGSPARSLDSLDDNNSDAYSLEKVRNGFDKSSLRLTLNDDIDEAFEVAGAGCTTPNCANANTVVHSFTMDGNCRHSGTVYASRLCLADPATGIYSANSACLSQASLRRLSSFLKRRSHLHEDFLSC